MPKAVLATLEARAVNDLTQVEVDNVVNQQRLMKIVLHASAGCRRLLPLLGARPQEHPRLGEAARSWPTWSGRPTPAHRTSSRATPRSWPVSTSPSRSTSRASAPRRSSSTTASTAASSYAVKEFEPGKNYYDPWQVTLTNVQQSMDYYLTGGDAESLHYKLKVLPAPMVTAVSLDYEFPDYTKIPAQARTSRGGTSRRSWGPR